MKLTLFTLFIIFTIGFASCRKDHNEPDIKQYDEQQIQNYISSHGLTGMTKDTSGKDTTGIWYKVLTPGTGQLLDYPDSISYVYTVNTFDNKYLATDTVLNHFDGLLGHVSPNGLVLAIHNILKRKGAKMRVLIPSHLAYGTNGVGSGSSTVTNNRIGGNQCLDYTIYVVNKQDAYDDLVIKNYMAANGLSGYTKLTTGPAAGMYYKITTLGTGKTINDNSSVACNYVTKLMNNTVLDDSSTTTETFGDLIGGGVVVGFTEGLKLIKEGGTISLLIPSRLGYGVAGRTGVPQNACLSFENITNVVVTNY